MSNAIQTDVFSKSVEYWLRRANKSKEIGQLRRAAVLFRHAARIAPESLEACMGYANLLRELHCYESSNREAFAALAYDAERFIPYGLIGRNMRSLGKRQEAVDAFTLYMLGSNAHSGMQPEWEEEAYELEEIFYGKGPRRQARLNALLDICMHRLMVNDMKNAERALARAGRATGSKPDARLDMIEALLHESKGNTSDAVRCAYRAMHIAPNSCKEAANAATLLYRAGEKCASRIALLRAAMNARYAIDEQIVCFAAENIDSLDIALAMLKRNLRREPDRLPTCFNICVCLLKMTRMELFEGYINLCREIDPDDVPTEYLFERLKRWKENEKDPLVIFKEIVCMPFYGMHGLQALKDCQKALEPELQHKMDEFSEHLMQDGTLYRNVMYALALPGYNISQLLPEFRKTLPPAFAERFLREVLLCPPGDDEYKRIAATELVLLGANPPFTVWHEGHIACMDPSVPPPKSPRLMQQLLSARLQRANDIFRGGKLVPFGLKMLNRMTKQQRCYVAGGGGRMWPLALCIQYSAIRDLPAVHIPSLTEICKRKLEKDLELLKKLCAPEGIKEQKP